MVDIVTVYCSCRFFYCILLSDVRKKTNYFYKLQEFNHSRRALADLLICREVFFHVGRMHDLWLSMSGKSVYLLIH